LFLHVISAFRKAPPDTDRYATGTIPEKTTQESLVPTETNGDKGFSTFFWIYNFAECRCFFDQASMSRFTPQALSFLTR
jgi:hypothetical protein